MKPIKIIFMKITGISEENVYNKNTEERSILFAKEKVIDTGTLIGATGRAFFSYPNLSIGENDFFKPQLAHRLILSRIIKSQV